MSHLDFIRTVGPRLMNQFAKAAAERGVAGRIAQSLFRPSPPRPAYRSLNLHPKPMIARVLAEVAKAPAGIYACSEPSGSGLSSTFELAAAQTNGMRYISSHTFRGETNLEKALSHHLGIDTTNYRQDFETSLDCYHDIMCDRSTGEVKDLYEAIAQDTELNRDSKLRPCTFVMTQPTLVIDDAHRLLQLPRMAFDDLIQFVRLPACDYRRLKVILLSNKADFAQDVSENVSGMSSRLRSFRLPRGSLGDLREHIMHQLNDKEVMSALPPEYSWLRSVGEAEVKLWLGVAGDNLDSIDLFLRFGVRSQPDVETHLRDDIYRLQRSTSKLLRRLASEGAKDSVAPGAEIVRVKTGSTEHKEALEWEKRSILRPDNVTRGRQGTTAYTWHHAALRLCAARAFNKTFRPLDVNVPPRLQPVEAVPFRMPEGTC